MNHQRAVAILGSQTNLAQRVFKCVPIQEWWTVHQIANEMDRHGPHNHTKTILGGCLRTLKEAGLVDEGPKDTYRSAVKPTLKRIEPVGEINDKTAPTQPSLVDRLINEATKLRAMAETLDNLAVGIDDEIAKAGKAGKAGNEKLKLLRELLAS